MSRFEKLYNKIDELCNAIKAFSSKQDSHNSRMFEKLDYESNYNHSQLNKFKSVIESQQRTIEQLTSALQDKYEHGLFVLSNDGKNFMLIKNGEKITNDRLAFCRVTWTPTDFVSVETEYMV